MIRGFLKLEAHSSFQDNIWYADLAEMQLIGNCNKRIRFSLFVIDIFSKYTQVFPLKNKKDTTITNAFQNFLHDSGRKTNKIRVKKDIKFYNGSMKS